LTVPVFLININLQWLHLNTIYIKLLTLNVYIDTKNKSIEIFKKYVMVFENINDKQDLSVAFEDWYVHPDLVDMNYINELKNKNKYNGSLWCANINY